MNSMEHKPKVEFIDDALLADVAVKARQAERLRINYNFHRSTDEPVNRLLEIKHIWSGISTGITSEGELIVKRDDEDVFVCSGEVSIRGVYGYME